MKKLVLSLFFIITGLNYPQLQFSSIIQLDNNYAASLTIDSCGNFYFATTRNLFISTDGGVNWIKSFSLPDSLQSQFIEVITVGKRNEIYLGTGNRGEIFRSLDTGKTWKIILSADLTGGYVEDIVVDSVGTIYAATVRNILILPDHDSIWQSRFNGFSSIVNTTWSLFISKNGTLFAGTEAGLYRSINSGMDWSMVYDYHRADFVCFTEANNGTLYMGGTDRGYGLYSSLDDGLTWKRFGIFFDFWKRGITTSSDGKVFLVSKNLYSTTIDNDSLFIKHNINLGRDFPVIHPNGYLYLTYSGSLLKSTERVDIDRQIHLPPPGINYTFLLEQNYPNPFNSKTKIKYSVPSGAVVSFTTVLNAYDVLGNKVATLVNENKPAGDYEVEFDTKNLSSGIYFYQLRIGEFFETKKMILLK
ncbi:MAG: T9SS type A sorting domain-containing protein [Ignavibacteriaceae bacterium]|nr:T9SS type A sorting domain-containing protein [Ignavibacteriaceae bacterium]